MSQSQANDSANQAPEGANGGLPNERNPLQNGPRNARGQSEQQRDLDGFRYLRAFHQPPGDEREFVMDGFDGGDAEDLSDEEHSNDGTGTGTGTGTDQDTFASRSVSDAEEDTAAAARTDVERQRVPIFRRLMRRRVQRLQDLVPHNHVHGNASAHLYLGLNMQDLPSTDVEQSDSVLELPLVVCPGVILFPGEVLPLRVSDPAQVAYLRSQTEPNPEDTHRIQLAVLSDGVRTGVIGTIAEIKARRSSHAELMLIGEGIKRFKLLQLTPNARPGLHLARVEVLKDVEQPWRPLKKLLYEDMAQPFPSWVYEPYHVESLMEKADRAMIAVQGWHTESEQSQSVEEIGTRPVPKHHPLQFSYWLSANLPLGDSSRQELLEIDDASIRLRRCIQHLERIGQMYLCCKRCRAPLSRKQHIVTVPGADGTVGAYVNPHGVVHQTVTVSELLNDRSLWYDPRPPTTEDTWFPNYAWRVAYCGHCYCHLGWKFTATFDDAVLQEFWGLSRRSIDDRPTAESEEQDEEQPDEQDADVDVDAPLAWADQDAHAIEHDQALALLSLIGDWRRMLRAGALMQNEAEEDDDEDERSLGSENSDDEL